MQVLASCWWCYSSGELKYLHQATIFHPDAAVIRINSNVATSALDTIFGGGGDYYTTLQTLVVQIIPKRISYRWIKRDFDSFSVFVVHLRLPRAEPLNNRHGSGLRLRHQNDTEDRHLLRQTIASFAQHQPQEV